MLLKSFRFTKSKVVEQVKYKMRFPFYQTPINIKTYCKTVVLWVEI